MNKVTVVSPHLDDAVQSVGALIWALSRSGVSVTVLTVLAGDPAMDEPAGWWDAATGFATAGEAAKVRRREDRRACRMVGAEPIWLPYWDDQYDRGADDATIASQVVAATRGSDVVLVPGFPLLHADHAWVAELVSGVVDEHGLGFYVEQPYAAQLLEPPRLPAYIPQQVTWAVARATLRDTWRKTRAIGCYRSQRSMLGPHWHRKSTVYERLRGGETVAWPPGVAWVAGRR